MFSLLFVIFLKKVVILDNINSCYFAFHGKNIRRGTSFERFIRLHTSEVDSREI